ncbi:hypothetical protein [Oerskovia turbata]
MASLEQARAAKDALQRALAGSDGVTGIGLTRGPGDTDGAGDAAGVRDGGAASQAEPGRDARGGESADWRLQVNVLDAAAAGAVPPEVDGVAVVVRVTGRIEAG